MFFMTTVMITCTVCGRNYKRCTGGKRHFWNCPTAVQTDLPSCGTSQIPEKLLYDLAAEVLGLAQFDEGVFLERVKGIDALPDKTLVFNFKDGSTAERHWEHISRVKSWTPEMKEIARQRALRKEGVRNGKSRNGHSTDKYRRTIWRCNSKFTGEEKCQTPHLTEDEIKARFLDAFNALVTDKERLLDECRTMQAALTDTGSLDSEIAALLSEMEVVAELTKRCIEENSTTAQDQATYLERYNGLAERYETAKVKLEKLQAAKAQREAKAEDIGGFMFELAEYGDPITEFDNRLWLTVIDTVTVHRDGQLTFKFQTGHENIV